MGPAERGEVDEHAAVAQWRAAPAVPARPYGDAQTLGAGQCDGFRDIAFRGDPDDHIREARGLIPFHRMPCQALSYPGSPRRTMSPSIARAGVRPPMMTPLVD